MTMTALAIVLMMIGAVALAVIDKALSRESSQFPCAHPMMRWAIRLYALAVFNRAAVLTSWLCTGQGKTVGVDILFAAAAMALAHCMLLSLLLNAKLPSGMWSRLERRLQVAKRSSDQRL